MSFQTAVKVIEALAQSSLDNELRFFRDIIGDDLGIPESERKEYFSFASLAEILRSVPVNGERTYKGQSISPKKLVFETPVSVPIIETPVSVHEETARINVDAMKRYCGVETMQAREYKNPCSKASRAMAEKWNAQKELEEKEMIQKQDQLCREAKQRHEDFKLARRKEKELKEKEVEGYFKCLDDIKAISASKTISEYNQQEEEKKISDYLDSDGGVRRKLLVKRLGSYYKVYPSNYKAWSSLEIYQAAQAEGLAWGITIPQVVQQYYHIPTGQPTSNVIGESEDDNKYFVVQGTNPDPQCVVKAKTKEEIEEAVRKIN